MVQTPTARAKAGATRIDAAVALLNGDAEMKAAMSRVRRVAREAAFEHPGADPGRALGEHANAAIMVHRRAIQALAAAFATEIKLLAARVAEIEAKG